LGIHFTQHPYRLPLHPAEIKYEATKTDPENAIVGVE
jgi:hypothetical protein